MLFSGGYSKLLSLQYWTIVLPFFLEFVYLYTSIYNALLSLKSEINTMKIVYKSCNIMVCLGTRQMWVCIKLDCGYLITRKLKMYWDQDLGFIDNCFICTYIMLGK